MYVSPQSTITLLHDMMLAGRHIIASSSRLLWSITISSSHTVGSRPCSCLNASNTRSHARALASVSSFLRTAAEDMAAAHNQTHQVGA